MVTTGWWTEAFVEIPSGIPSGEAFGSATVATGGVAVRPAGIASGEAFGTATAINGVQVHPSGIPSGEAFGSATVAPGGIGVHPSGISSGEAFGTAKVSVLAPIAIDQIGTPGSEGIGDITCTINPSSGADVVVFAWCSGGASSCFKAAYSGLPMKFKGRVKFNGGTLSAFLIENMGSGAATITVNKTGSDWAQCVALSYSGAADFRQVKISKGSGTTASQSASPGVISRSIGSFARGGGSGNFTSPTGGTNRINDSSGFVAGTVSDTSTSATFSASISSSANWGGVVVDALTAAISTPRINYTGGIWSEVNGGTQTFTVKASVGDYIVVDMVQSGNGDPSSVTCAGVR